MYIRAIAISFGVVRFVVRAQAQLQLGGSGGMFPQKNFWILEAMRVLLRPQAMRVLLRPQAARGVWGHISPEKFLDFRGYESASETMFGPIGLLLGG